MAFFEQKVGEPKLSKDGSMTVRTIKVGNKVLAHIEVKKLKDPADKAGAIYWGSEAVIRPSPKDLSFHVTRISVAGLQIYGVRFLGVRFPDGSSYLTPLSALQHPTCPVDNSKPYYVVPKALWVETLPPVEVRVHNTMDKMRVGRVRKSSMTSFA